MSERESLFPSRAGWVNLPREWAINWSWHPRWKDKNGCRWHVQVWHPYRHGFILSARGIVR